MNLNIVYDRAYENAMRQGYVIDGDVLRACIEVIAHADPPFDADQIEEIFLYIKEKPELLPTDPDDVLSWGRRWASFFNALRDWKVGTNNGRADDAPRPPLLCDFGL